jgi:3-phenylpropionate/trans-cinnamate dioxygenase ferredoxin reductase component
MAGMVIIGAGECGVRAAFALREHGYSGAVTLIGEEYALPYERPPLSKGGAGEPKAIRREEDYATGSIDLRLGARVEAIEIDNHRLRLNDGGRIDYDQLLIATGARARLLPGMDDCLTLRTNEDANRILQLVRTGARVGIVGGGFIGLELAATARSAGAEVTVIEAGPRILGRGAPEEIAEVFHRRHAAEGVDIRTGSVVAAADAATITLTDGDALEFDLVIAGVGAHPNTEMAEAAGLRVSNGIVVDGCFRTSAPNIFAAGDCCNFPWRGKSARLESWKAAQDQGAHAAAAMLGEIGDYGKVPWFWSDQYDLSMQAAGLFDPARETIQRKMPEGIRLVFQLDEAGCVSAAAGIGPGNSVAKDIRIFEKLIERGTPVHTVALADPAVSLKSLLRAA